MRQGSRKEKQEYVQVGDDDIHDHTAKRVDEDADADGLRAQLGGGNFGEDHISNRAPAIVIMRSARSSAYMRWILRTTQVGR